MEVMYSIMSTMKVFLLCTNFFLINFLLFVYRLFDLVAEDNAVEDATYFLGKALNSERIDLNSYMKVNIFSNLKIFQVYINILSLLLLLFTIFSCFVLLI